MRTDTQTYKGVKVFNPNVYLDLNHDFTVVQKKAIHFVIKTLQEEIYNLNKQHSLNKQKADPEQSSIERTLFGDCYFSIPVSYLDPSNQHTTVRDALKGLKIPIDDKNFVGDFLLKAERKDSNWVLLFPEKTVHFLTDVSKGLTPLETLMYISVKGKYTLLFYEYLMRYRNWGRHSATPEKLFEKIPVPASYKKNFNLFKQKALDPAQAEMKKLFDSDQCEMYFEYREERGGQGRKGKIKRLDFTIIWKGKESVLEEDKDQDLAYVANTLRLIMIDGQDDARQKINGELINKSLNKLLETGRLKSFAKKLEENVMQNPEAENKGALARYILINDYHVNEE